MSNEYWENESEKFRKSAELATGLSFKKEVLWPQGDCGWPLVILHPAHPTPAPLSLFSEDESVAVLKEAGAA